MSSNQKTVQSVGQWPEDVGILAMEVYFPSTCVAHSELEQYDGVGSGKYTIGLGQTHMGFCGDQEDINSLCLTAVKGLVDKAGISYSDIGRLEVGTETILDKSKSVKTVLMKLFATSGNSSVDGIDTTNACYGGTQALFNAVAWVESSLWDGRLAVVVAADIAVYASGSARPTGGAGAVAMLIGPKAPLVMERGLRGVHMEHTYDFYKPDLSSEYPVVDGKLSIQCYLTAVDNCYKKYVDKASTSTAPFSLKGADFFVFHSPFTKLVVKSLARLLLNDFVRCPTPDTSEGGQFAGLSSLTGRTLEDTLGDRVVEKLLVEKSSSLFKEKTQPSVLLGTEVGNMYTASVYGGLASLLVSKDVKALCGKRVVLFSYGSGLAAAMYSFKVCDTPSPALSKLLSGLSDIPQRLSARTVVPPAKFEAMMKLRQDTHHKAPYVPETSIDGMFPGTFYLTNVDDKHRRSYNEVAMATTLSNGIQ